MSEGASPILVRCLACFAKVGEPCTAPTETGRRYVEWFHLVREDRAQLLAPDGYRYGVQFTDGTVTDRWMGPTQRQRAFEFIEAKRIQQEAEAGRHDDLRLVRRRLDEVWEEVPGDE